MVCEAVLGAPLSFEAQIFEAKEYKGTQRMMILLAYPSTFHNFGTLLSWSEKAKTKQSHINYSCLFSEISINGLYKGAYGMFFS